MGVRRSKDERREVENLRQMKQEWVSPVTGIVQG